MIYAFDFWNTLRPVDRNNSDVDKRCSPIREIARKLFSSRNEIHIVSAISPGLPLDSDKAYASMLAELNVPYTAIHRVDHVPQQKVDVLVKIKADVFIDDSLSYVEAARAAGIKTYHLGVDEINL